MPATKIKTGDIGDAQVYLVDLNSEVTAKLIPAGVILMWSGLIANIPTGWALCDGTNGTPNLLEKFIKGVATSEDPGATGGAATHTHATHDSHPATATDFASAGASKSGTTTDTLTRAIHTHNTPILSHSAHDSPNSEPVFFKLAFIIKT